jgi:hypothetical protein
MAIGWNVGVGVGAGVAVNVGVGVADGVKDGTMLTTEAEGRTTGCEISPVVPLHAVARRINANINRAAGVKFFFGRILYFR